ncbi:MULTISPECIES: hypothetical protein [Vibrio]|uniref:Uncharacterized protein n=1 Tax=Vibrio cortegadensis TaxID=1328770 RepID=A0ABV4M5C5_9VIBR|nr:hypothetical protein [Vibrio splendidus]MDH6018493.1 hypothetical protein [Vibrio splendidus]
MTTTVKIELKGRQVELMPAFVGYRFTFKAVNPHQSLALIQNAIEHAESSMAQLEILDLLLSSSSIHSHFHIISSENGVSIQSLDKEVLALYGVPEGELLTFSHFESEVAEELIKRTLSENIEHH